MDEKIVLVHGFNKNSKDMAVLKNNLGKLGYCGILADLPLTFQRVDQSVLMLEGLLEEIAGGLKNGEKVNLVGHSAGGIVIRRILASGRFSGIIKRCVLVATPNNGSELADLAAGRLKVNRMVKALGALQSQNVKRLRPLGDIGIDIGAIAGNRSNLLFGKLLDGENDGRVTVASVKAEGLKDFVVLPYGHKEIHRQFYTAELITRFLKSGSFSK